MTNSGWIIFPMDMDFSLFGKNGRNDNKPFLDQCDRDCIYNIYIRLYMFQIRTY